MHVLRFYVGYAGAWFTPSNYKVCNMSPEMALCELHAAELRRSNYTYSAVSWRRHKMCCNFGYGTGRELRVSV